MSRDPVGFGGGDWNVYGYVGARPVSIPDPTGMLPAPGPSCGPDVTLLLRRALRAVRDKWRAVPERRRSEHCLSLVDWRPWGPEIAPVCMNAWDIDELHKGDKVANYDWWMNRLRAPCCLPRPRCADTVVVAGECHRGYSVNYALFGLLWKLCEGATGDMRALIRLNKCMHGLREVGGALEWADAGYEGWPQAVTPSSTLTEQCPNRCPERAPSHFHVHWHPEQWFAIVPR